MPSVASCNSSIATAPTLEERLEHELGIPSQTALVVSNMARLNLGLHPQEETVELERECYRLWKRRQVVQQGIKTKAQAGAEQAPASTGGLAPREEKPRAAGAARDVAAVPAVRKRSAHHRRKDSMQSSVRSGLSSFCYSIREEDRAFPEEDEDDEESLCEFYCDRGDEAPPTTPTSSVICSASNQQAVASMPPSALFSDSMPSLTSMHASMLSFGHTSTSSVWSLGDASATSQDADGAAVASEEEKEDPVNATENHPGCVLSDDNRPCLYGSKKSNAALLGDDDSTTLTGPHPAPRRLSVGGGYLDESENSSILTGPYLLVQDQQVPPLRMINRSTTEDSSSIVTGPLPWHPAALLTTCTDAPPSAAQRRESVSCSSVIQSDQPLSHGPSLSSSTARRQEKVDLPPCAAQRRASVAASLTSSSHHQPHRSPASRNPMTKKRLTRDCPPSAARRRASVEHGGYVDDKPDCQIDPVSLSSSVPPTESLPSGHDTMSALSSLAAVPPKLPTRRTSSGLALSATASMRGGPRDASSPADQSPPNTLDGTVVLSAKGAPRCPQRKFSCESLAAMVVSKVSHHSSLSSSGSASTTRH